MTTRVERPVYQQRIDYLAFGLFHLTALMAFWTPFSGQMVVLCLVSYYVRMFGITGGYHRYFSHKTYQAGRVVQFCLAWLGAAAGQKGPLWWAAMHRHHHKYSDRPEDHHSPIQHGVWHAHAGWVFDPKNAKADMSYIPDLLKFPELQFIEKNSLLPTVSYALLMYGLFDFSGLVWGYFISSILLYHGTFTINSLCHVFGTQRYKTGDTSRNNFWLALITLGEGWHNNHHYYQHTVRQGFYWYEFDPAYYVITIMSWLGLVSRVRKLPEEVRSNPSSLIAS